MSLYKWFYFTQIDLECYLIKIMVYDEECPIVLFVAMIIWAEYQSIILFAKMKLSELIGATTHTWL